MYTYPKIDPNRTKKINVRIIAVEAKTFGVDRSFIPRYCAKDPLIPPPYDGSSSPPSLIRPSA
jgi:hypothetical protein